MVGEPAKVEVESFAWDEENVEHLAEHGLGRSEAEAVFNARPQFFVNLPGRTGTHIMIGPDATGRFYYFAMAETSLPGVWRVVTGYRYARRRALKYYRRES